MLPLLGFSPDVEQTTPGCITACENLIPYETGMKSGPTALSVGLPALAAACYGSSVVRQLVGTSRAFAGTASNLYEASGSSWTSVGSGYTLSADERWVFVGFGDSVLASSAATTIQRSTGGSFSAIAGAPKAKCLAASQGFVLAFATNEGTYGDSPDRWWCCALYDETDWTPNIATQCATGRLVGGSGGITAAVRFGDEIIAYKQRAIFRGIYVGDQTVWQWTQVAFDVGCVGPEACADTSVGHIFVGTDDIYLFDGTRPIPIGTDSVRQWWQDNSSPLYRYKTKLLWDRDASLVWIFYPSVSSSGICDAALVYHVRARKWGFKALNVEAAVYYVAPGVSYDTGPTTYTYDTGPDYTYDSPFWVTAKSIPAVFETDHVLKSITGAPGPASFTTGDYGSESKHLTCTGLWLRFAQQPDTSTCQGYTKTTSGEVAMSASLAAFDGAKYPLRQTARFHSFKVSMTGPGRVSAIEPALTSAGSR